MKKIHEFRETRTYTLTATDVRAAATIIEHYEKLGFGVTNLAHQHGTDAFEYVVRITEGNFRKKDAKVYDVLVNGVPGGRVRELERVLIVDFSKVA